MRLTSLTIENLPGIDDPIEIPDIALDVNAVTGPNASGKSSIVRAVEALLYPDSHRGEDIRVSGTFDVSGTVLHGRRRYDRVTWSSAGEPSEAPTPPDHRHFGSYKLAVEDLNTSGTTEEDLAEQLLRDLAGGYDLRKVRSQPAFHLKMTHGKAASESLRKARADLRKKRLEQQGLKQQEDEIGGLEEQKAQAIEARTRAQAYQDALDLLDARHATANIRDVLKAYPPDMDLLHGSEAGTLEGNLTKLAECETDIQNLEGRLVTARDDLTKSRLEGSELTDGDIKEHRERIDQFRDAETGREDLSREFAAAQAALAEAASALGVTEIANDIHVDPETVSKVESLLRRRQSLQARIDHANAELSALPKPPEAPHDVDEIYAGEQDLNRWLTHRPTKRPSLTLGLLWAVGAVALSGAVLSLALTQHLSISTFALLLVLALTTIMLARNPGRHSANEARQAYEARELQEPTEWAEPSVTALIKQLRELRRLAEQNVHRTGVERRLADLKDQLQPLNTQLHELSTEVGFDGNELGAEFARWLTLAHQLDQGRQRVARAEAELEGAKNRSEERYAPIHDFLALYGEAPGTPRASADVLRERLDALADRLSQLNTANQTLLETTRQLKRRQGELAGLHLRVQELLVAVGLDNLGIEAAARELRERQDQHTSWQEKQIELAQAESIERDRARKLEGWDNLESLIDQNDRSALEQGLETAKDTASKADDITQMISDIAAAVRQAEQERELESLEATRSQAESELKRRLREALLARAGRLLLDQAEAEYQQESQPALLQDARQLFAAFTRHQFDLRFDPDAAVHFYAIDTGMAERRTLDQLSTGTRAQLLLATRTAFARQAERGRAALPFFLDEALTTSDAGRFKEIVSALRDAASEDERQLFYLTARPEDIPLWATQDGTTPHTINLADGTTLSAKPDGPAAFAAPLPPAVPQPNGKTPEEYAVAIGVPAIDPWADPASIHVFHLLRDDLGLLHRLLTAGIQRLGHLRALLSGRATRLLTHDERSRLSARISGAEAWVIGWRTGRGRPANRGVLIESGAVSDKYIDDATEILTKANGDATRLLHAINSKELKGFHNSKRDDLEAYLLEHGHIVHQDRLTPETLRLRVLDALADHGDGPDLDLAGAEASRLATWCEAAVALG